MTSAPAAAEGCARPAAAGEGNRLSAEEFRRLTGGRGGSCTAGPGEETRMDDRAEDDNRGARTCCVPTEGVLKMPFGDQFCMRGDPLREKKLPYDRFSVEVAIQQAFSF